MRSVVLIALRTEPPMTGRFRRHAVLTGLRLGLIGWVLLSEYAEFRRAAYDDILGVFDVVTWGVVLIVLSFVLILGSLFQLQWFVRLGMAIAVGVTAMWTFGLFTAWRDGRGGLLGMILVGFYGLKDFNMLCDTEGTFVAAHKREVADAAAHASASTVERE